MSLRAIISFVIYAIPADNNDHSIFLLILSTTAGKNEKMLIKMTLVIYSAALPDNASRTINLSVLLAYYILLCSFALCILQEVLIFSDVGRY